MLPHRDSLTGSVNNLLATAAMRMEARTGHLTPQQRAEATPTPEDFTSESDLAAAAAGPGGASAVFADLIGCKAVLEKLQEWQATITACQRMGKDPLESFELNFAFVGAPGDAGSTHCSCLLRLPGLLQPTVQCCFTCLVPPIACVPYG